MLKRWYDNALILCVCVLTGQRSLLWLYRIRLLWVLCDLYLGSPPVFWWARVANLFQFSVLCFLFTLSSSCVLCTQCCQFLWIVNVCLISVFSTVYSYSTRRTCVSWHGLIPWHQSSSHKRSIRVGWPTGTLFWLLRKWRQSVEGLDSHYISH